MIKAIIAAAVLSLGMYSTVSAGALPADLGLKAAAASEVVQVKGKNGGGGHAARGGSRSYAGARGHGRRSGGGNYGDGGGWNGGGWGGPGICTWVGPVWVCP
jgi:uncharacterized membrane protein